MICRSHVTMFVQRVKPPSMHAHYRGVNHWLCKIQQGCYRRRTPVVTAFTHVAWLPVRTNERDVLDLPGLLCVHARQ